MLQLLLNTNGCPEIADSGRSERTAGRPSIAGKTNAATSATISRPPYLVNVEVPPPLVLGYELVMPIVQECAHHLDLGQIRCAATFTRVGPVAVFPDVVRDLRAIPARAPFAPEQFTNWSCSVSQSFAESDVSDGSINSLPSSAQLPGGAEPISVGASARRRRSFAARPSNGERKYAARGSPLSPGTRLRFFPISELGVVSPEGIEPSTNRLRVQRAVSAGVYPCVCRVKSTDSCLVAFIRFLPCPRVGVSVCVSGLRLAFDLKTDVFGSARRGPATTTISVRGAARSISSHLLVHRPAHVGGRHQRGRVELAHRRGERLDVNPHSGRQSFCRLPLQLAKGCGRVAAHPMPRTHVPLLIPTTMSPNVVSNRRRTAAILTLLLLPLWAPALHAQSRTTRLTEPVVTPDSRVGAPLTSSRSAMTSARRPS